MEINKLGAGKIDLFCKAHCLDWEVYPIIFGDCMVFKFWDQLHFSFSITIPLLVIEDPNYYDLEQGIINSVMDVEGIFKVDD